MIKFGFHQHFAGIVATPTSQCFLNYAFLALYLPILYFVHRRRNKHLSRSPRCCSTEEGIVPQKPRPLLHFPAWKYAICSVFDVEANFMVVYAYHFTTISSVMLILCVTSPCVMILSAAFLRMRYSWPHFLSVFVTVGGASLVLLADGGILWMPTSLQELLSPFFDSSAPPLQHQSQKDSPSAVSLLIGDALALGATFLYACSNVGQEYLLAPPEPSIPLEKYDVRQPLSTDRPLPGLPSPPLASPPRLLPPLASNEPALTVQSEPPQLLFLPAPQRPQHEDDGERVPLLQTANESYSVAGASAAAGLDPQRAGKSEPPSCGIIGGMAKESVMECPIAGSTGTPVDQPSPLEFLGMIGVCGAILSGVQVNWGEWHVWCYYASFAASLFLFYSFVPLLINQTSASFFSISVLTANVYGIFASYFLFGQMFSWTYVVAGVIILAGIAIFQIRVPQKAPPKPRIPP